METAIALCRAAHMLGAMSLLGTLLFRVAIGGPALRHAPAALARRIGRALHRLAWASLVLGLAGGAAWLLVQTAVMTGAESITGALPGIPTVLERTEFGHVLTAQAALLLLAGICLLVPLRQSTAVRGTAALIAAVLTVVLHAAIGHAAAMEGTERWVLTGMQALHLAAAGAWIGALLPLLLFVAACRRDGKLMQAAEAARRFSPVGMVCVAALAAGGTASAWVLVGSVPNLVGTPYGQALTVKIALFLAMLALAAVNRFRLTPRLANAASNAAAADALRRSVALEAALAAAAVLAAGFLAAEPPAIHDRPWWPLPFRFDAAAIDQPGAAFDMALALGAALAGIVLLVASRLDRANRAGHLFVGCAFLAAAVATPLRLLAVEANPTSFWTSPTGYTAASVARGKALFATNCTMCHGADGRGGGPAVPADVDKAATDLTAEHIYLHRDGDLFWWISEGRDGRMPGFAAALDETARWNLIDFVHANADAARLAAASTAEGGGAQRPIPAPDLSLRCGSDGRAVSLRDLRGRIVRLILPRAPQAGDDMGPEEIAERRKTDLSFGIETVAISQRQALSDGICIAADPGAAAAYGLFAGSIDGTVAEFLVDVDGRLRAVAAGRSWADPMTYAAAVAETARRRFAKPETSVQMPSSHGHNH